MRSPILYTFTPCWCRSLGLTPPDGHIREYIPICRGVPLVAQMVKNLPAMQKTQVQSLGGEDPLEREWLPMLVFLSGEFMDRGAWWATVQGSQRVGHD